MSKNAFPGGATPGEGNDTTQQGLVQLLRTFNMLFILYLRCWGQLLFNSIAEDQKMRTYLSYTGGKPQILM